MAKLILYGTGIIAEKFYYSYCDEYDFSFCIDCRERASFHGIRCYTLEEAIYRIEDCLIVVASTWQSFKIIKQKLKRCGLKEFRDFVWCFEFHKELVILYGNCHMAVLNEFFLHTPEFTRRYATRIKTVHSDDALDRVPDEDELSVCRILICQDIREDNGIGVPGAELICSHTEDTCTCIIIPNLFGVNLFFPQFYSASISDAIMDVHLENIMTDYYSQKYYDDRREIGLIICTDQNINSIVQRGGGLDECLSIMTSKSFYDRSYVIDIFNKQISKLKEREKACDIIISDYIVDNYRSTQLFYDPEHPCEKVICEKGNRILNLIGINQNREAIIPQMLNSTEMFIYDSVRNALSLEYRQEYIRVGKKKAMISGESMDRTDYIEQMIKWNYS